MKSIPPSLLCLLGALLTCAGSLAQAPSPPAASFVTPCTLGPLRGLPEATTGCCGWVRGCFPRCGCPDDYCPIPYPRPCWPPYPPFYQCVPAGHCGPSDGGQGTRRLTWWFLPTPQALREALWCHP
jgi:hypothetical protein